MLLDKSRLSTIPPDSNKDNTYLFGLYNNNERTIDSKLLTTPPPFNFSKKTSPTKSKELKEDFEATSVLSGNNMLRKK